MIKQIGAIILFLLGTIMFSQENNAAQSINDRAVENAKTLIKNPEAAFLEAKKIEAEAKKLKAPLAELRAIDTQCNYYKTQNDFKNMMISAESLFQQATLYKITATQATAKRYLFEAAIFSGLPDKALKELEEGMDIVENSNDKNSEKIIRVKADLLITYSNYYSLKNDFKNRLKYIKLSGKEYERLPEGEDKQYLMWLHYSNMAGAYKEVNELDSAKYFAQLSLSKDQGYENSEVRSMILSILGDLAIKENDFRKALSYFKETERLQGYQNHYNIQLLYDNIILSYQKLQIEDSARIYIAKKDSLKLNITENQNKSLQNLLNEKEGEKENYKIILIVCALVTVVIVLAIRKKMILGKKVDNSQHYLKPNSEIRREEDYSTLLEMFKKNDLAFIIYFNEVYPEFSQKLIGLNPKISQSEIEFSAYLKLKIPTKDIVRYRNLAHRTVQNKKYIIRKRLNIPKEKDIYQWFDDV